MVHTGHVLIINTIIPKVFLKNHNLTEIKKKKKEKIINKIYVI
jgi:hypothetical protein